MNDMSYWGGAELSLEQSSHFPSTKSPAKHYIYIYIGIFHSGRMPYLGILTYFETNYPFGNIHYVEIPSRHWISNSVPSKEDRFEFPYLF